MAKFVYISTNSEITGWLLYMLKCSISKGILTISVLLYVHCGSAIVFLKGF